LHGDFFAAIDDFVRISPWAPITTPEPVKVSDAYVGATPRMDVAIATTRVVTAIRISAPFKPVQRPPLATARIREFPWRLITIICAVPHRRTPTCHYGTFMIRAGSLARDAHHARPHRSHDGTAKTTPRATGTDDFAAGAYHAWAECPVPARGDLATGPRSGSPGGGTASSTRRATARRCRACCPVSSAARPEIVVVCSSGEDIRASSATASSGSQERNCGSAA
jgi:hypothetical protein